jgi:ubiquinone/menaquinone biosynthesis C-methylase UbiE
LPEFTGERVIPGLVDRDLWNEHLARYLFASRLCRHKRVLDLACGSGYGSATLAQSASVVIGLDNSSDAIAHARSSYPMWNLHFLLASATTLPFGDRSFDLITAFELIEHLHDWQALLEEARRLLKQGGQLIVSTPNHLYYTESRRLAGPNPFHVHEFEFAEFQSALRAVFPHVSMFVQNHADGVVFRPLDPANSTADLRMETGPVDAATSHFFLAVCAMTRQTGAPTFVYLPSAANVLREREMHIMRLEQELAQKDEWLAKEQSGHQELLAVHREQTAALEASNRWAAETLEKLNQTGKRVVELQDQLDAEQRAAIELNAVWQTRTAELEADVAARTQWAMDTEQRLTAEIHEKAQELAKCVELLHDAERTIEERTVWAQRLERERADLEARLSMVQASRWYKLGRRFGMGPDVASERTPEARNR